MRTKILLPLCILLALTACKKTIDPKIALDRATASVASAGATETLSLTCNCSWTAAVSNEVITVDPLSGEGDATVRVTIPANTTGETRSLRVTFTAKGTEKSATAKFAVTQEANPFVQFPTATGTLTAAGGGLQTALEANEAWSATPSATGITVSPASGNASQTLTLTVPANTTGAPVVHTVTVALTAHPAVTAIFTLTQSN